jgi:uncharacterized protein
MPALTIGTTQARPGEITYGTFPGLSLPTGGQDDFPVIIAQGKQDGPVMWITSGIHGGEHTGIITIQQLITPDLVAKLHGTLIVVPVLSPGGLRTKQRQPYYSQTDPNRLWPRPERKGQTTKREKEEKPIPELEVAYQRLFDAIEATQPACLFDLHNAWFGSIPFAFRDPVFFRKSGQGRTRADARKLQARVGEMLEAFGFTIVNEFVADDYVSKNLHRSVSGSVLNGIGIPATTIELGSWMHIDRDVANAAMCGLRNAMRWLDMLPDEPVESIEGIPVIHAASPVRRTVFPYAPKTGIVHHLVRPGEAIKKGQPLVRMTDVYGRPLFAEDSLIFSEFDGFVIAWHHGIVHYQGDPILDLAIHDDSDLVVPYPD